MTAGRLAPFLAALLPGDGHWPSADRLDLDLTAAAASPVSAAALAAVAELPPADPVAALTALADRDPATFGAFQVAVYGAYYSHPSVLLVIEERCGYPARAPQPSGHVVPLAGPDPLPTCVGAAPRWRADGTGIADRILAEQAADPDRVWTREDIEQWRP
jgi:hypothetical protein